MIRLSPRLHAQRPPVPHHDEASSSSDSDIDSLEDLDGEGESLQNIIGELKEQITTLNVACGDIRGQVKSLFRRARTEEVKWMDDPLKPRLHLKGWLQQNGLGETPSLREFLNTVFSVATSMDLESRVLTFTKKDASVLWSGETRLTIFDIIAQLPQLFH